MNGASADLAARIASAISQADADFGYSIKLVRLVDEKCTYSLKMPGFDEQLFSDYEDASEEMLQVRDRRRAEAVLNVLTSGTSNDPIGQVCCLCDGHGTLDHSFWAIDPCLCQGKTT